MKKTNGFTLMEVLVAVMILAIITIAGFASVQALLQSRETVTEHQKKQQVFMQMVHFLRRDLSLAIPRTYRDGIGEKKPPFAGTNNKTVAFTFVRGGWRNPAQLPRSALQWVQYRCENGMIKRGHFTFVDQAPDVIPLERTVIEGVKRCDLEFLDASLEWQNAWPVLSRGALAQTSTASPLPLAVRVNIDFEDLQDISLVMPVGLVQLPDDKEAL